MLNMCSKTEFLPISLNCYLSNEKNTFVENSRVEPTIFFMEKNSFSLKLLSGHFIGNPSLRPSEVLLKHACILCAIVLNLRNMY